MATETFDQRFKRLTSDMLMIDICRILGIEIRDLMKIRSGVRIDLPVSGLRRLCQEQSLDFHSFAADIDQPWSAELRTTEVITSEDAQIAAPTVSASSASTPKSEATSVFRADGSRQGTPPAKTAPPRAPVLTVNNETHRRKPTSPAAIDYTSATAIHEDGESFGAPRSLADRFRDGLASAFKRIESELDTLPDNDEEFIPVPRVGTTRNTERVADRSHEIASLVAEVTLMRRELNELSTNVRRLLIR